MFAIYLQYICNILHTYMTYMVIFYIGLHYLFYVTT